MDAEKEAEVKLFVMNLRDCFLANFMDRKIVLKDINDIIFWTHSLSREYYQKFEYSSKNEKFRERIELLVSGDELETINHEFGVFMGGVRSGVFPSEKEAIELVFFSDKYLERLNPV